MPVISNISILQFMFGPKTLQTESRVSAFRLQRFCTRFTIH